MADKLNTIERSLNMSKIRSTDTSIERVVRRWLFSRGFRFRKNDKRFIGTPDVVLPKYKTMIMIHGCFWHGHENCSRSNMPKSNTTYWEEKIKKNKSRDAQIIKELTELGWHVIVIWECQIEKDVDRIMNSITKDLNKNEGWL